MSNRPCKQSDLRLNVDVRVDAEGKPLAADVQAFAADPMKFYEPPNTPKGTGVFYWCANDGCPLIDDIFYSWEDALGHLSDQGNKTTADAVAYEIKSGYAGRPHKGPASAAEQKFV